MTNVALIRQLSLAQSPDASQSDGVSYNLHAQIVIIPKTCHRLDDKSPIDDSGWLTDNALVNLDEFVGEKGTTQ